MGKVKLTRFFSAEWPGHFRAFNIGDKRMPLIFDIPLRLDIKQVLRRQGIKEYTGLKAEIKVLIHELLGVVKDSNLLHPSVAYERYAVNGRQDSGLLLKGNSVLHGTLLPSVLKEAKEVIAIVYTIGPELEERVAEYIRRDEHLRGLLLDGIGNAAVDSLTQEICKTMSHAAVCRGSNASSPLNPGMPGFPISEQWRIFKLVPAGKIGVTLTRSGMMVPRKSSSMVIGIGQQMTTWSQAEVCARCILRETCPYRIHN